MSEHVPALPLELDPLIAEAKQRARRRRLALVALALAAVGAAAWGVRASVGGGGPAEIPWLPIRPQLGSANPPLAAPCTASQLKANLFLQGAAGNLAGPISIVNRSSQPCALVGRPRLSFAGAPRWRVERWQQGVVIPFDPLAPPLGSLRALPPGEHVWVQLWIPGICDGLSTSLKTLRALVLTAPGGGQIRLDNRNTSMGFPTCDVPAATRVQATRFMPYVPQGPPSSALPLRVRIVGAPQLRMNGKRIKGPVLAAHAGSWLSYTVVLTNRSRQVFRFGRTCPAYTEGIGADQNQAFILNCHAVDSIAAGQSVRFAMRVRVPQQVSDSFPPLGWTLAPHSWNAPGALAVVHVR